MTLLAIKLAATKVYTWVKHHTALLLVIVLFVIGLLLFPKRNMKLSDILEMSGRLRRDELDKLEKTYQQEVTSTEVAGKSAVEKVIRANETRDESLKLLQDTKREEIRTFVEGDQTDLARKIATLTGATIHEMDDVK